MVLPCLSILWGRWASVYLMLVSIYLSTLSISDEPNHRGNEDATFFETIFATEIIDSRSRLFTSRKTISGRDRQVTKSFYDGIPFHIFVEDRGG